MHIVECPTCRRDFPWDGPEGIFRHIILEHPETPRARAVFLALCAVPLPSPEATTPRSLPSTSEAGTRSGRGQSRGLAPSHHPDAA
jgi:hypothetical protein